MVYTGYKKETTRKCDSQLNVGRQERDDNMNYSHDI